MIAPATPEPAVPPEVGGTRAGVDLDAVQQQLFAVALGVRGVRSRVGDAALVAWLERIEDEIDDCIRAIRPGAQGQRRPSGTR